MSSSVKKSGLIERIRVTALLLAFLELEGAGAKPALRKETASWFSPPYSGTPPLALRPLNFDPWIFLKSAWHEHHHKPSNVNCQVNYAEKFFVNFLKILLDFWFCLSYRLRMLKKELSNFNGKYLLSLRLKKGLTRFQLALKAVDWEIKLQPVSILRHESGYHEPGVRTVRFYADYFEKPFDSFYKQEVTNAKAKKTRRHNGGARGSKGKRRKT